MPFKTKEELEEIRRNIYSIIAPMVNDFENKTWQLKSGSDKQKTGLSFKGHNDKIGTVWKLEAILDISPDEYYERFIKNGELVGWVPHLAKYSFLERSEQDDSEGWEYTVTYSETLGFSAVSGREFISINFHKKYEDGSHLCMTIATEHPDSPKKTGLVRGEYLPSASLLKPSKEDPKKCELYWVNNVDMKGFMLRSVINLVMSTFMLEFATAVITKSKELAAAASYAKVL